MVNPAGPHDSPAAAVGLPERQGRRVDASAVSASPAPTSMIPRAGRAETAAERSERGKALRLIKRALSAILTGPPARAGLRVLLKAGKYSDAKKSCERALALEPSRARRRACCRKSSKRAKTPTSRRPCWRLKKRRPRRLAKGRARRGLSPSPAAPTGPKKIGCHNVDFLRPSQRRPAEPRSLVGMATAGAFNARASGRRAGAGKMDKPPTIGDRAVAAGSLPGSGRPSPPSPRRPSLPTSDGAKPGSKGNPRRVRP